MSSDSSSRDGTVDSAPISGLADEAGKREATPAIALIGAESLGGEEPGEIPRKVEAPHRTSVVRHPAPDHSAPDAIDGEDDHSSSRNRRSQIPENSKSTAPRGVGERGRRKESFTTEPPPQQKFRHAHLFTEFDEERRSLLEMELSASILSFIEQDRPVWLEGLGIVFPTIEIERRARVLEGLATVRREKRRILQFEKCAELVTLHREKFPGLAETKHLAQIAFQTLARGLIGAISERSVGRLFCGLLELIRYELVVNGHCSRLSAVGEFFALHNRQGSSFHDWFAGADIRMIPSYRRALESHAVRTFERPVLEHSWEVLEAAFGNPLRVFEIDDEDDGGAVESPSHTPPPLKTPALKVAVFNRLVSFDCDSVAHQGERTLIYCTNGLRSASCAGRERFGHELVVQLSLPAASHGTLQNVEVPLWPIRTILRFVERLSRPEHLALLPYAVPFDSGNFFAPYGVSSPHLEDQGGRTSILEGVLCAPLPQFKHEQIAGDGSFTFVHLLGISAEEVFFSKRFSARALHTLLRQKGLHLATKTARRSLFDRCVLLAPDGRELLGPPSTNPTH